MTSHPSSARRASARRQLNVYRAPSLTAAALLCALGTAWTASAQEWTRFRGPDGAGQSDATGIPHAWTDADYAWKTRLPGVGNSSPVAWGDKIFLMSADSQSGTRYVLCVSATNGQRLWTRDYQAATHPLHMHNSFASSTPTVDADHVYCAWATPAQLTLAALRHDGSEAWQARLGPYESQHGFGTSPILHEDLVILANEQDGESFLLAIDRTSGKTRWKQPRRVLEKQNAAYASPFIYRPANGPAELIVSSWAHGVCGLDPLSGSTRWEAAVLERRPVGSPILVEGLILANCGEGSGNNHVVAVRPGSAAGRPAELAYQLDKTSAPYVPTLLAHGALVFLWGDRGVVTCIDGRTGNVHWRKRIGGNFFASPIRIGHAVYCVSVDGEVVVLAAADQFKELGRTPLGEGTRATPAVAGGRLLLRTESQLMAVGPP
jgi:outer membrane protein assembly factor BamB